MGWLSELIDKIFGKKQEIPQIVVKKEEVSELKRAFEVRSLWDFLQFGEHSQAFHLASVIRFDEWVPMDEIRRRIFELFQIDYENERSLYPYLKTMVDIGLIETTNAGGKRKWRKKDLLIKLEKEGKKEEIAAKEAEMKADA